MEGALALGNGFFDDGEAFLGSVDLRTMEKFTYSGDLIYFEAFQPNKDRSKEWMLKGDPTSTKEVLNNWATVLQEIYNDVKGTD